jgi:hypothetical protein
MSFNEGVKERLIIFKFVFLRDYKGQSILYPTPKDMVKDFPYMVEDFPLMIS